MNEKIKPRTTSEIQAYAKKFSENIISELGNILDALLVAKLTQFYIQEIATLKDVERLEKEKEMIEKAKEI